MASSLWLGLEQENGSGTIRRVRRGDGQHPQIRNEKAGSCARSRWQAGKAGRFLQGVGDLEGVHEAFTADDVHALELRVVEHVVGVTGARGSGEQSAGAGVVNGQQRRLAAGDVEPGRGGVQSHGEILLAYGHRPGGSVGEGVGADLLEHSWAREEAAKAAASADVVLISISGDQELPAATEPWMNLWSELRGNSAQALGLLFDSERLQAPEAVETALYFYRFALDCGIDGLLGWSDTTRAERWSKRCDRRADKRVGRELESTRNFEMQTNPHGL